TRGQTVYAQFETVAALEASNGLQCRPAIQWRLHSPEWIRCQFRCFAGSAPPKVSPPSGPRACARVGAGQYQAAFLVCFERRKAACTDWMYRLHTRWFTVHKGSLTALRRENLEKSRRDWCQSPSST